MLPLSEVARDVAEALGLKESRHPRDPGYTSRCYQNDMRILWGDGSNLTDPYWFKACCEWLLTHGWDFACKNDGHECWKFDDSPRGVSQVDLNCPWPEAPARLVSAVWRRMQG